MAGFFSRARCCSSQPAISERMYSPILISTIRPHLKWEYCWMMFTSAETGGASLPPSRQDERDVCRQIVAYLADKIGVLLEAGVPEVHRSLNMVPDTDGVVRNFSDAGIVYTPGGNFVLTIYTYHPVQVVFDTANQLFASLTQAAYNYFKPRAAAARRGRRARPPWAQSSAASNIMPA
jgi:hypothetical protein